MEELIRVIAKSLVDDPEAVDVSSFENENGTRIIELRVAPDDMGKVIGKQGRIAKAMRTVLKAATVKDNARVVLEIVQ